MKEQERKKPEKRWRGKGGVLVSEKRRIRKALKRNVWAARLWTATQTNIPLGASTIYRRNSLWLEVERGRNGRTKGEKMTLFTPLNILHSAPSLRILKIPFTSNRFPTQSKKKVWLHPEEEFTQAPNHHHNAPLLNQPPRLLSSFEAFFHQPSLIFPFRPPHAKRKK